MYTTIIIDDEPWSLLEIQKTFPFEEFGFFVKGVFQNSLLAMQEIISNPPDLIVTDIRMPRINGLDLIDQLREKKLPCEVIISSGYNDFSYAKRALRQGVFGYCLKPTDPAEATSMLRDLKNRLDEKAHKSGKAQEKTEAPKPSSFDKLVAYVDNSYNKKLTLGKLALKYSLNPNYCCDLFAKNKGVTFSQYLTELRIEKAKELLTSTDHSIAEISDLVGFADSFYFSKVFKKTTNISPSKYRGKGGSSFEENSF